jgi:hypothetical protein
MRQSNMEPTSWLQGGKLSRNGNLQRVLQVVAVVSLCQPNSLSKSSF